MRIAGVLVTLKHQLIASRLEGENGSCVTERTENEETGLFTFPLERFIIRHRILHANFVLEATSYIIVETLA